MVQFALQVLYVGALLVCLLLLLQQLVLVLLYALQEEVGRLARQSK